MIWPLFRKPRKQATRAEPRWWEQLDWNAIGTSAAVLAGGAVVALLLIFALDRPVRRVLLEGDFQRVSPPEIEGAVAKVAQPVDSYDHSAASASSSSTPMKPPDCLFQ